MQPPDRVEFCVNFATRKRTARFPLPTCMLLADFQGGEASHEDGSWPLQDDECLLSPPLIVERYVHVTVLRRGARFGYCSHRWLPHQHSGGQNASMLNCCVALCVALIVCAPESFWRRLGSAASSGLGPRCKRRPLRVLKVGRVPMDRSQ